MPFRSDKLLAELDKPEIIDWALELKNGKDAYAFLMRVLGSNKLNVNQTRNGLHALFLIRGHGNSSDILQKFAELAHHADREIRSEAVQLTIGLVELSSRWDKVPLLFSDEQKKAVREAVARGVNSKVTALAKKFFNA